MSTSATKASSKNDDYRFFLKKLKRLEILISTICIIGLVICLYALQVEIYKSRDNSYVAYCDLNEYFSCSKVFSSRYIFYCICFTQSLIYLFPDNLHFGNIFSKESFFPFYVMFVAFTFNSRRIFQNVCIYTVNLFT